jgi:hypothetical protein
VKRLFLLLFAAPLALIPLHAGCSGQTEGQYCTLDTDCAAGLTCITPGSSTHTDLSAGVCCTSGSTVPACLVMGTTTTANLGGSGGTGGTGAGTGGTTAGTGGTSGTGGSGTTTTSGTGGSGTTTSGTGGSGTGGTPGDAGTGDAG